MPTSIAYGFPPSRRAARETGAGGPSSWNVTSPPCAICRGKGSGGSPVAPRTGHEM
ncbi:hypothetical protein ACWDXD_23140 [Streptomyces sp. NPDC003314]